MPQISHYPQGTPNWVDLQTTDQSAAKQFYASLLGWSYEDNPMPQGAVYSMATVNGETVAAIAPMPPGAPEGRPPTWNTYIAADDVDAAVDKVGAAGGQGGVPPFDIGDRRSGADGLRRRSDRPGRGAVAGHPPHRRDAGRRARRAHLERIDHGQAGIRARLL